jgi:hypothetical protein
MLHDAIRALYPNVITIVDTTAYDKDDNIIEYDFTAAESKAIVMQDDITNSKKAAEAKLAKLGLTADDLKNILG